MFLAESGNAADLQTLMDYVKSAYLPFMKAYGEGDYNIIYTQLMAILRNLTGIIENTTFEETIYRHIAGSFQHGTNYVPQTGSYMLHQGEAVISATQNAQPQEIHVHLDVDGRQIGYVITKELRSNSELINAVRRVN